MQILIFPLSATVCEAEGPTRTAGLFTMGNKQAKQERGRSEEKREARKVILVKVVPPLDRTYVRWLARDLDRIYGFAPIDPPALEPPDHYIEYMRLNGWLDVDLDDPDLAHLFK